ncbi:soluble NSF attachment protein-like protein, partial [Jimgerdemannia flammicorona]
KKRKRGARWSLVAKEPLSPISETSPIRNLPSSHSHPNLPSRCILGKEAGEAYGKAADLHLKSGNPDDAAQDFLNVSSCFKKVQPEAAIDALHRAIAHYKERGSFSIAARHQKGIAEIYESDLIDLDKASEAYEAAAELYIASDSPAQANNCLLKVAHFQAQLENYQKAIEVFESVAESCIDDRLTRYSTKEYFLKAGLCVMSTGDLYGVHQKLEKYINMDVSFEGTRECQFLRAILDAVENGDIDIFTQKVVEYDQMTKLDNWKTTLLLRIKKSINDGPTLT